MSTLDVDYNSVIAYERSKDGDTGARSARMFTIMLLAVFFIVMMVGLVAGVSMYRAVSDNQIAANEGRIQAGLLVSTIHANDIASAVSTGEGPEGKALVLTKEAEDGSAYEVRLYLYEGNIMQEYSVAGAAYVPERAQALISLSTFDFELQNNLLVIRTDQGVTNIALRSYQGGAQ